MPSEETLRALLKKLDLKAVDILRTGEEAYKAHFKGVTQESDLITLLRQFPKVIERPIIVKADKAIIARPPEAVLAFMD